ncbi:unnamed protein product [Ectocarpus sp. 8 AP-2014]
MCLDELANDHWTTKTRPQERRTGDWLCRWFCTRFWRGCLEKAPARGRGPYKKTPRITDEAECEGVEAMVKAIGKAFQRAKVRTEVSGKRDGVHHYMALPSSQASRLGTW